MPAGQFLECLVGLAGNEDAGVSRRALKLFATRTAALTSPTETADATAMYALSCQKYPWFFTEKCHNS